MCIDIAKERNREREKAVLIESIFKITTPNMFHSERLKTSPYVQKENNLRLPS